MHFLKEIWYQSYIYMYFFENFDINWILRYKTNFVYELSKLVSKEIKIASSVQDLVFACEWKRALDETSQVRVHPMGFERPSLCEMENLLYL